MSDLLADGNVKATWVLAIANIAAPTVAELTAGSAVDLEWVITADGLDVKGDTSGVDNTALASTGETEDVGRIKRDLSLTVKRKDTPSEDVGWSTLTYKALGYLVIRNTLPVATAYAAGQEVEVHPVRCGEPSMLPPEKNSVRKFTVKLFNHTDSEPRATVAA